MTPRLNRALLVLALLIGLPTWWFLIDNTSGKVEAKAVSIDQLRSLASAMPGPAPTRIEGEIVGWRRVPGNLFAAGSGFKRRLIGIIAWRLPVEGGKPVLIDTGIAAADAHAMKLEAFFPERQARVDREMVRAGLILVTHEHPDHEGALVRRGVTDLGGTVALNPAQLPSAPLAARLAWKAGDAPTARITGNAPQAVAPGVVVIPAPSHTPGSQMIYVRFADGREALFAGDIATLAQSWEEQRARSRLVGRYIAPENRTEVYSWLATIAALKRQAPGMLIIPGHDPEWVFDPENHTGIRKGFSLAPTAAIATRN